MEVKLNLKTLKQLSHQVDCSCSGSCFKEVGSLLPESQVSVLKPSLKVYAHYILGKYYYRLSGISSAKGNLEKSNAHFDEVFIVSGNYEVREAKRWFKRIHTKFVLAQYCSASEQNDLLLTALQLCEEALERFPISSSINWIYTELTK